MLVIQLSFSQDRCLFPRQTRAHPSRCFIGSPRRSNCQHPWSLFTRTPLWPIAEVPP